MIHIKILSPGKIKDSWLHEAIGEYLKRLTPVAQFELLWTKDEKQFAELLREQKEVICLDPRGKMYSSEAFADYFFKGVERGGSSLAFAIGGAEGFPEGTTQNRPLLSLSPMTFTHQHTRLLLIEQIFRAFEIQKGTRYHK